MIFRKKFSPKETPCRSPLTLDRSTRKAELDLEDESPVFNIDGQRWKFEGKWIAGEKAETDGNKPERETHQLKKRNVQVEEEINLLKLKNELLMDMLTEKTIECRQMEQKVEDIKTQHRRKK